MSLFHQPPQRERILASDFSNPDLLDTRLGGRAGDYDRLIQRWLCTGTDVESVYALWTKGEQLTGISGTLFIDDIQVLGMRGPNLWEAETTALGFIGTVPDTITLTTDAGSQTHSVAQGSDTFEGRTAIPSATLSYFTTTQPDVDQAGENYTFPAGITLTPPDNPWGELETVTLHMPNGWILSARKSEPVVAGAVGLWRVTDEVIYQFEITPG